MTVATMVSSVRAVFTGAGVYNFLFKCYNPTTDLRVTHISTAGVSTVLSYGANPGYTAALGISENGTVTVADSGVTLGTTGFLLIERTTAKTQATNWENGGPMDMETLERSFDKLTMIAQELSDSVSTFVLYWRNKGSWAASTAYVFGDLVLYSGTYYLCMTPHTSGGTFDATKWFTFLVASHTHTAQTAVQTPYNHTTSGLAATEVQGAIDELKVLTGGQPERYRGLHSAAGGTNPAWSSPITGDYGYISVGGTIGGVVYAVGDRIIYNGATWDRIQALASGPAKNLFRNPNHLLDTYGKTLGAGNTGVLLDGWYQPTNSAGTDDGLSTATLIGFDGAYPDHRYLKVNLSSGTEYLRGQMAQMLDYPAMILAGKKMTVSADIESGSMAVYVIPKAVGTAYNIASLASIVPYLFGTLTSANRSVTGTVPAAGGTGAGYGYIVLFIDMKTNYSAESYSCRFKDLKCELGETPTQYQEVPYSELFATARRFINSTLPIGDWTAAAFGTAAAASGGYGALTITLCQNTLTTWGIANGNITYRQQLAGTLQGAGPYFFSTTGAAGVNVGGTTRAVEPLSANRCGSRIRNISGVTWSDQTWVQFHYYVQFELL